MADIYIVADIITKTINNQQIKDVLQIGIINRMHKLTTVYAGTQWLVNKK